MFVGQTRIQRELSFLIPEIQKGKNCSILLVGPSGCGKTTLAYNILNRVGFNQAQISGPPDFMFDSNIRVHFLDEVHQLENPEALYSLMDSSVYTILLATNELGDVKEPLANRCIPLVFDRYSNLELCAIANQALSRWNVGTDILEAIVNKGKANPRIVKKLCERLDNIFPYHIPRDANELDQICEEILGISKDGLTAFDRRYLEFLRTVGGTASLDLLANTLRLSKATILRDIEPHLIYLGLVTITSRGRSLVQ